MLLAVAILSSCAMFPNHSTMSSRRSRTQHPTFASPFMGPLAHPLSSPDQPTTAFKMLSSPASSITISTTPSHGRALLLSLAVAAAALQPLPALSLGVGDGLLDNCQPARVTCVSSQDDTPTSFLEPWEYDEELEELQQRLVEVVLREPRAALVVRQPRYLRFEIPTATPDVVDDLEFFFPPLDKVVHFRSARRDRSFDFLLNRRRLDRLRQKVHLAQIPVLRNRMSALSIFETPFDSFGPSAVDVDALIDNRGLGSRPVR